MDGLAAGLGAISRPHPLQTLNLGFPGFTPPIVEGWASLDDALQNRNLVAVKVAYCCQNFIELEPAREKLQAWFTAALPRSSARGLVKLDVI